MKTFTQSQLQAIADAFGEAADGLTGLEIGHLLATVKIADTVSPMTKRHRSYNAFANDQNKRGARTHIIAFIRKAKPERFAREAERIEPHGTSFKPKQTAGCETASRSKEVPA
ncbi:hypothetical protein RFM23_31060 [Mesorhizobium abyssinicae]|uniref:Uncharacterized protein n=1 Tax=Mesorhizobium abyssinicae TaxID=1209958 RepID=A0ABU5AXT5_9HYPH|nr:hypothetical protein [Mesorhizobium abyssinicae]MDX8542033.1 hypothetical protein [Mesorhizobium abyssinicae]